MEVTHLVLQREWIKFELQSREREGGRKEISCGPDRVDYKRRLIKSIKNKMHYVNQYGQCGILNRNDLQFTVVSMGSYSE